jgi:hypothetical protein
MEDAGKGINILFNWCNENGCIVGVEGGADARGSTAETVEITNLSGSMKDGL